MATPHHILQIVGFSVPMLTSLFCFLLIWAGYGEYKHKPVRRKLNRLLMGAYLSSVFTWLSIGFYLFFPRVFVYIQSFTYLGILMTQVFIYHIVFILTNTKRESRFCPIHYFIPVLIWGILFCWSFFVPFSTQLFIVESMGKVPAGYAAYTLLFTSKIPVFLLYNVIYSLKGLIRIRRYRERIADYAADAVSSSMRWLYLLFYITLATIPISVLFLALGNSYSFSSVLTLLTVSLTVFQDIIFCYNTFSVNYILLAYPEEEKNPDQKKEEQKINKARFEKYIETHKPYLNPKLRITDMSVDLHTNRSYLSAFINKEYQMNFNRYIHTLRIKELEIMRKDPACCHLDESELITKAGFNNHYAYRRIKSQAEQQEVSPRKRTTPGK